MHTEDESRKENPCEEISVPETGGDNYVTIWRAVMDPHRAVRLLKTYRHTSESLKQKHAIPRSSFISNQLPLSAFASVSQPTFNIPLKISRKVGPT